ncbi:MAG: rRNA maturation RNase YbeY [Bacilli bacterium]|nr:rRNA maturation RNase YbeY [Bacilli bacterium]
MNELEVFNETNDEICEINELKKLLPYLANYFKLDNIYTSVIIVDNNKIHQINKEYRNMDKETDVISFALEDDKTINDSPIRVLGDIYISIDKAKEQAKEYNHSLKRELCFLMTHGFLHLLGYDHMKKEDEEIMFPLQEKILDEYGVSRNE